LFYRVMALFRRGSGKRSAELTGYRLGPTANDITVLYEQGMGDGPGEVEVLDQDAKQVRVRVSYDLFNGGLRILIAIPREVVATLQAPLQNRKVVDESGGEIPPT
jgi:hypothetical protein